MGEVLYLCHRIPYPPNKGDKIRSYHWLRALAADHRVHLGAFVDDPDDWTHRGALAPLCDRLCLRPLPALRARIRSLNGLWRREALSFAYYRDRLMARWVKRVLQERPIDAVFAFSSTMAPYALAAGDDVRRVIDFVDVDSDKWRQYAAGRRYPMRWVYAREGRYLAAGEQALATRFDASLFVSEAEAAFFRGMAPDAASRVHALGNGVDASYFDPGVVPASSQESGQAPRLVFTGAMDYGANEDAVVWFVGNVLALVRAECPRATFTIVGTRPTRRVQALARTPGVTVTGAVPDVRPYLAQADVVVAPMRIARGIQNKVLEALAMGCPTVMTSQAASGLEPIAPAIAPVVDDAGAFANAVIEMHRRCDERADIARRARNYVLHYYAWDARFRELCDFLALDGGGAGVESDAVARGHHEHA